MELSKSAFGAKSACAEHAPKYMPSCGACQKKHVGKALGDDNSVRGGVRADFKPKAPMKPGQMAGVKNKLSPLKDAMVAAAKKKV